MKRIHAGNKVTMARMSQIDPILNAESVDLSKLAQLKLSLEEKLETLASR